LLVSVEWQLVLPAALTGAGQAILYPAVVAGGSAAFPDRYRGLGTTLVLGAIDFGTLAGAPLVGGIVDRAKQAGLPGYSTMFLCIAGFLIVAGAAFAAATGTSGRSTRDADA
jgi:MFS family permease